MTHWDTLSETLQEIVIRQFKSNRIEEENGKVCHFFKKSPTLTLNLNVKRQIITI